MFGGALLAALALATPAAATPTRTCAARAEAGHPQPFRSTGPSDVRLGPAIFVSLERMKLLTPAELSRSRGRLPFHKAGVLVKASRVVRLSIAPASRRFARLGYDNGNRYGTGSLDRHPSSVVIRACPKTEPAFSFDGAVGPATGFPGGFITDGTGIPRCVTIELRQVGKRRTYTRTVPFGSIRC
jgi:hypothetical protein